MDNSTNRPGRGNGATATPGYVAPVGPNRSSQVITTIIPANGSIPVFQAGKEFYLSLATAAVDIIPNKGPTSRYTQGTGLIVDDSNLFNQLQVSNPNSFSVVISLFVGFGGYVDNRTTLFNPLISNVIVPTYPTAASLGTVPILDKTGTAIVDINGNNFLALARNGIYVSNIDLASVYNICDHATGLLVALAVQPQTEIVFPASGDLQISVPAGTVNAIVSEIYSAVRPGFAAS
jgi:hypothetical protein